MHEQISQWWNGVSLRTKITGVTVLLVTMGLLVAGVGTMTALRTYLLDEVDHKVAATADGLGTITITGTSTCVEASYPTSNYFLAILNSDGEVLCTNVSPGAPRPMINGMDLSSVAILNGRATTITDSTHTQQWRVVALTHQISSNKLITVVLGLSLSETNGTIGRFTAIFLGFGLSVVILGAALTRLLVTTTFAPLRKVEATAAAIAEGDFSQRLPGATPNTEVGRLNRSLNTMLNRIDRAFGDRAKTIEQMRRFVGDASHELRTPLVTVRGYAELYRMGALQKAEDVGQAMERIEKEAIRMGELVEDLLELARIDETKTLNLGPVDLLPIAQDAALDTMASAPGRSVRVILPGADSADHDQPIDKTTTQPFSAPASIGGPADHSFGVPAGPMATGPIAFAGATLARLRRRGRPNHTEPVPRVVESHSTSTPTVPAIVLAEENKIRQVITNLIGNALRFTPADSPIELAIQVDQVNRVAMLDVIDHGEGIAPQIREKIFQRFWRADTSRTRDTGGSGLGLAIVSAIVASHNGKVEVLDTPGGGATFRVILPLLPDGFAGETKPARA